MVGVDFSAVFDAMPVACALMSPDLKYVAANRAYEQLAGRSRDQLIGHEIFEVFPGGSAGRDTRELRESLDRVVTRGEADIMPLLRYDVEIPGRPGIVEERHWNVVNAPVPDADGKVSLIINRVEEVTAFIERLRQADAHGGKAIAAGMEALEAELFVRARDLQEVNRQLRRAQSRERKATAALREALQRQQQAVADTSHDLRGPLTGLQTRLQVALFDPDADSRQVLHAALHDAERLGEIVADLLELARLEAGVPIATEPVDLTRLVESKLAGRRAAVTVALHLDPGIVVQGSAVRLARLLDNLVTNAERHASTRAEVSVTAAGDHAVLEVIDDGPGIPADEREAVFQRFYRRPDARNRDPEGTGLGLPIARQIAHAHGGTLRIADQPSGTRMILRLPLYAPSNHPSGTPAPDGFPRPPPPPL